MTETIIARIEGCAGRLSLNRPKAIHALDLDMVLAMTASLHRLAARARRSRRS